MHDKLTLKEAYAAMYAYLEEYYARTGSDDIGSLLGGMSLLSDGSPADPAAWEDWECAVRRVANEKVDTSIVFRQ